jgi:micrococcal nuclease
MSIERLYRYRARVHRYPASIYDGDTFRLDIDYGFRQWHMNVKCRLADVNCPSIKGDERPAGLAARDFVREQLAPPVAIEIVCRTPDPVKYGRYLVDVYIRRPEATDWTDLGATLLDTGHAVPYPSSP